MKCPFCSHSETRVVDSRLAKEGEAIRRRRECEKCHKRFTTYEHVEETFPAIIKKDGRREPYDRHKILAGLQKACEKRPVSTERIEEAADQIEREIQELGKKEIPSSEIGERVMRELHRMDQVAYVRFASVYREFKDLNEFMNELSGLLKKGKR
ncbi:MAG: transcriptional repressor NrdR [Deltaproteobacteria bacterium]|nr:transcriptional repressor NrdR [Deltaproteobacteria bacterium]MBI2501017.1 transcriptional repressor NrdR [Deltaproteobacteria bacterium]MBI4197178.1 transcriptional repressor NrdR [Deltaproteobacteria bacterium]